MAETQAHVAAGICATKGDCEVAREASEELHVQRAYGGKNGQPGLAWPERCWWGLAGGWQMTWAPVDLTAPDGLSPGKPSASRSPVQLRGKGVDTGGRGDRSPTSALLWPTLGMATLRGMVH